MRIRFLDVARDELRDAILYYNAQKKGLGREFRAEVRAALSLIRTFPHGWQPVSANARRCRTNRFPYGVVYQIRNKEILIVVIAHLHRRPDYWTDRI